MEVQIGGRNISLSKNDSIISSSAEVSMHKEEIINLEEKTKKLQKVLESNKEKYKTNIEQYELLNTIIQKNQRKIKNLKFKVSNQKFNNNKDEKNLVSGFASFLDTCSGDLSNCKQESPVECSATYMKEVLFTKMVRSKSECLDERSQFINQKSLKLISSEDFVKDQNRNKVVTYKYKNELFKIAEINNCLAITTTTGHDRKFFNTHGDSTESCLRMCKDLYISSLLGHEKSALSCLQNTDGMIATIAIIARENSLISKLWNDKKLNSHLNEGLVNIGPRFDKNGKFLELVKLIIPTSN